MLSPLSGAFGLLLRRARLRTERAPEDARERSEDQERGVFRAPTQEAIYTTLLMSTGLTFVITRAQYSAVVAAHRLLGDPRHNFINQTFIYNIDN
jgi:hypothetical protein